jgi:hypothetical protein
MEVIESVKLENLPNDVKVVDALISSSYGEFVSKNPNMVTKSIEIIFTAGTPNKTIKREVR